MGACEPAPGIQLRFPQVGYRQGLCGQRALVRWEVDTIFGFDTEHAALDWIEEKSAAWVRDQKQPIKN